MLIPFNPPPGLNSDDTAFSGKGSWVDTNNFRWTDNGGQPIGGWLRIAATQYTAAKGTFAFLNSSGQQVVLVASNSGAFLSANVAGTDYNITPAISFASSTFGTFGKYGNSTIIVCAAGASSIAQWDTNPANVATALTNSPANTDMILVTPERQVLAFACVPVAGGSVNKLCIRGSDIENITSWTPTATNNAFEDILDGGGSVIRAAEMIGPYVAVWTDTSLFLGQFTGNFEQTYRWDKVADGCGAFSLLSVEIANGRAFWFTPEHEFMTWAPGELPQVLPCPISRDFRANFYSGTTHVGAWHNNAFDEIWWFYPDARDTSTATDMTRYVAYCIASGLWFRGQMQVKALGRGPVKNSSGIDKPYTIDSAGRIVAHETGSSADGSAMGWHVQSADQYLDESQRRIMIRSVSPDFDDQVGDVSLTLYVRDRPQASATTKGPFTLSTSTTKKDLRASGRLVAVKLAGSAAGTFARLGKVLFDVVRMGER